MFCQQPDKRAAVEADRKKLRRFIEETLRIEAPANTYRSVIQDTTLSGVRIPAGSTVNLRLLAANRDPRQFGCPADFNLERKNFANHVTFGGGTHACIGQVLARRELQWAFAALLDRLTNLRLAAGETLQRVPSIMFRALPKLEVTFEKRESST